MLVGDPVFPASDTQFDVIRRLRARDLPDLPDKYGELMQTLLVDCWKQEAKDRPSFAEIFDRFGAAHYQILPDADSIRIRAFAEEILTSEQKG
jgi:hypothetical protein